MGNAKGNLKLMFRVLGAIIFFIGLVGFTVVIPTYAGSVGDPQAFGALVGRMSGVAMFGGAVSVVFSFFVKNKAP